MPPERRLRAPAARTWLPSRSSAANPREAMTPWPAPWWVPQTSCQLRRRKAPSPPRQRLGRLPTRLSVPGSTFPAVRGRSSDRATSRLLFSRGGRWSGGPVSGLRQRGKRVSQRVRQTDEHAGGRRGAGRLAVVVGQGRRVGAGSRGDVAVGLY